MFLLSSNFCNKTFLNISIDLILFNSKKFDSVINKNSFILYILYNNIKIIIHPIIIGFVILFILNKIFKIIQKENQKFEIHPKMVI